MNESSIYLRPRLKTSSNLCTRTTSLYKVTRLGNKNNNTISKRTTKCDNNKTVSPQQTNKHTQEEITIIKCTKTSYRPKVLKRILHFPSPFTVIVMFKVRIPQLT